MTFRLKIYVVVGAFIVLALAMFLLVFKSLQSRNAVLSADVADKRQSLEQLLQEQRSFEQGIQDLENLKTRPFQPENLFSRDTRVVKEIQILEDLSKIYSLDMVLQISGTAKEAQKVKSTSELLSVPYTMEITGPFDKVLAFLDSSENLSFISPVKTLNITALEDGGVKATLTADFYLKK